MIKNKLNIAIFHLGFFFSGGGEKLVLEEAIELKKRGHEVSLFAPVIDKKVCFPDIIKKFKVKSLFFPFPFNFPLKDFISISGAVLFTPLTFRRFKKFDIFFGANQPGPLICYFLSKILKKPYVIYLAQPTRLLYPRKIDLEKGFGKGSFNIFYLLTRFFRPVVLFLDHISIRSADKVLVNGKYMEGIINNVYGVRSVVCSAGCHPLPKLPSFGNRVKGTLKIGNTRVPKPFLLITNRHFPQKCLDLSIDVLFAAKKYAPEISLVITGAPTFHTRQLKKKILDLGLEKDVIFTNLVTEKDLLKLYSQALIYLYTSPEEDFGMGVIEAMGAGATVIAWNNAGPSTTVINEVTGLLIKSDDKNSFIRAVIRTLKNKKINEKMGDNAYRYARDRYSYKLHNDLLEKEILEIVKNEKN